MNATSKTALLGGIAAVALIGAAWAYYTYVYYPSLVVSHERYSPKDEPPGHGVVGNIALDKDPFDTTITYTDRGFEPSDITIAQGTRVRFINKSSSTFWPAVGVHPSHTLYPEKESTDCLGSAFDACQDVKSGEFFDFTLYYPGTWPIHDHLHAFNTGTITVLSPAAGAQ